MTDEPQAPTDAERFSRMAERITHNAASRFGGAFVIVPPADGGDPMETLILDTKGDAAQFWMLLQAKSKTALDELQLRERQRTGFGR